ncbi:hypothetical protein B0H63DRAFT_528879 [Podospora didyma]|uniref:Amine oxidase domain-containing protein n=1 Tax=Podospora didyma TaxID=330526 RepID=A0AAE0K1V0_9PEZI|nr:hypothetical protein B0H63DRAFT_528879 [Podospora didyma]
MSRAVLLVCFAVSLALAPLVDASVASPRGACNVAGDTIEVDVALIGGGVAGPFAAVKLADVYKKTVVLIDSKDHLGGHVDTAAVPNPAAPGNFFPVDYGVQGYLNLPVTREFFQTFGINLVSTGSALNLVQVFVDFKTGKLVNLPAPSDSAATGAPLQKYAELCQKYFCFIFPNYNLPSPLGPDEKDLGTNFGQFVTKYNLEPIVPIVAGFLQVLSPTDPEPFLVPESHNNSEIYGKIQAHLAGPQLLLSSSVTKVTRSSGGAGAGGVNELWVQTPSGGGGCKHIAAKKILVTMAQTSENMAVFDLDSTEKSVIKSV